VISKALHQEYPTVPSRPAILLLDGPLNLEAVKIAAENEIILFYLPPHITHVAQLLNVRFFDPLKKHWARVCHDYTVDNPGRSVTKFQLSMLFNKAWIKSIQPSTSTIISEFRKVSVYLFNSNAIKSYSADSTVPQIDESRSSQQDEKSLEE